MLTLLESCVKLDATKNDLTLTSIASFRNAELFVDLVHHYNGTNYNESSTVADSRRAIFFIQYSFTEQEKARDCKGLLRLSTLCEGSS